MIPLESIGSLSERYLHFSNSCISDLNDRINGIASAENPSIAKHDNQFKYNLVNWLKFWFFSVLQVPKHNKAFAEPYNCSLTPPYLNVSSDQMYKVQKKLLYPVNVGRNVAREMAQTHYILPSDIELYPSPNISSKFLEMIAKNTGPLLSKNPKVFPLHIFEVSANSQVPETKTVLKEMLSNGKFELSIV